MRPAVALLAQGWYRGARGWWQATAAVLAVVAALVLLVVGVFEGMQDATQDRIEGMYTGDLRVTPGKPAAAPDAFFGNGTDPVGALEAAGGAVDGRLETTYVLSRRTLLESYQAEDEQFRVQLPGVEAGGQEFYGVGVLVGLETNDTDAMRAIRPYRVVGAFPNPSAADAGAVPIMLSVARFEQVLSDEERANLTQWPPTAAELAGFRFEITTARVDERSPFKDVIRLRAHVVGLFDTDLDAMDAITVVADIGDVRRLLGRSPHEPLYNVVTVRGGDLDAARGIAEDGGWQSEGPEAFSARYIGQLVAVVQMLSMAVAVLFFTLPVFLLWHGLAQVLDRNEREVAVCRAIGVPQAVIRRAVGRLTVRVCAAALAGAAVILLVVGSWLSRALPDWAGSPLPLSFHLPWWSYAVTLLLVLGSAAASAWFTIRSHERTDLASRLRSA